LLLSDEDARANFNIFDRERNNVISPAEFLETCRDNFARLPSLQSTSSAVNSATGSRRATLSRLHLSYMQLLKEKIISSADEEETNSLMWRVEKAHRFQEMLEKGGKSQVSIWQLDMHFARYERDPIGAVANAHLMPLSSSDRTSEMWQVTWLTASRFLARLGLERYLPAMEEAGYRLWHDFKHFTEDDWKNKISMSDEHAVLCHAVNTSRCHSSLPAPPSPPLSLLVHHVERPPSHALHVCRAKSTCERRLMYRFLQHSTTRPDLLRKFQLPEFVDLKRLFLIRFPTADNAHALKFARALTDELGCAAVSLLQVCALDLLGALDLLQHAASFAATCPMLTTQLDVKRDTRMCEGRGLPGESRRRRRSAQQRDGYPGPGLQAERELRYSLEIR
jgi:hypothetical protein